MKHETWIVRVGRASARHGRLKSALQQVISDEFRRCFTLNCYQRPGRRNGTKQAAAPCRLNLRLSQRLQIQCIRAGPLAPGEAFFFEAKFGGSGRSAWLFVGNRRTHGGGVFHNFQPQLPYRLKLSFLEFEALGDTDYRNSRRNIR